jgi:Ni/Fe-hydrogenase 1 B-type cytochrome subunit
MQADENITRRAVFDRNQRLTHWFIAVAVVFELVSAWLVQHADIDVLAWSDWHGMVGQALLLALLYRMFLMFRPGSGHWRFLIPTREQRFIVRDTLKFYLSLGRFNRPDWYAFNPVWQPIYLLVIIALLVTAISGYMTGNSSVHGWLANAVLLFTVLHIAAVFMHDARGRGASISAMLNGSKYFHVTSSRTKPGLDTPRSENSVSLDELLKK